MHHTITLLHPGAMGTTVGARFRSSIHNVEVADVLRSFAIAEQPGTDAVRYNGRPRICSP